MATIRWKNEHAGQFKEVSTSFFKMKIFFEFSPGFSRLMVAILLMTHAFSATAKQEEEFVYLLPEDYQDEQGTPQKDKSLNLTPREFKEGVIKYLKQIPQCSLSKLTPEHMINDGAVIYQELNLGGAKLDVFVDVAESGKISKIKFLESRGSKDESLQAIMCSTYAVMRTLWPDEKLQSHEQALDSMTRLWTLAADKPFEMSFFFDKIKAQVVPFLMEVNPG
ncbi:MULTISPECIES: hypothetical protein [unclassified Pseudomonas]|uniref:hypothetical protein n=1 Tax=unclassified Pseudomonas TaxID=196821 RepID=UPI00128E23D6|nr:MULTISPECIES: hypothetical protein [unclassified Pseudomonas]MPQ68317.1 hypothetical protein [Pseudomonas sp. MWU12-2323]